MYYPARSQQVGEPPGGADPTHIRPAHTKGLWRCKPYRTETSALAEWSHAIGPEASHSRYHQYVLRLDDAVALLKCVHVRVHQTILGILQSRLAPKNTAPYAMRHLSSLKQVYSVFLSTSRDPPHPSHPPPRSWRPCLSLPTHLQDERPAYLSCPSTSSAPTFYLKRQMDLRFRSS